MKIFANVPDFIERCWYPQDQILLVKDSKKPLVVLKDF
jgi:hypothetical protein